METKITLYKKQNYLRKVPSYGLLSKRLFSAVIGLMMMAGYTTTKAQTTLVVPDSNEGSAFIGPYGNAARQLQMIIDDTLLTSLVGKNLTSISFRLPASTSTSWPPNSLTMSAFDIYLSEGVEPAQRQLNFSANVVGTQTQVRSGTLQIPAGALTIGSNPNDFSFKITFTSAWQYTGGNLLIEVRHSGTGISSRSVQAASTSSAGYGTLYSALWQSTGDVLQGNFTQVEITADGPLGANSVKVGAGTNVYPNPVKDTLFIKSEKQFTSYSVYNMTGQMVGSDKIFGKVIDLSHLQTGSYVLKLTDKDGNTESAKFIKK